MFVFPNEIDDVLFGIRVSYHLIRLVALSYNLFSIETNKLDLLYTIWSFYLLFFVVVVVIYK